MLKLLCGSQNGFGEPLQLLNRCCSSQNRNENPLQAFNYLAGIQDQPGEYLLDFNFAVDKARFLNNYSPSTSCGVVNTGLSNFYRFNRICCTSLNACRCLQSLFWLLSLKLCGSQSGYRLCSIQNGFPELIQSFNRVHSSQNWLAESTEARFFQPASGLSKLVCPTFTGLQQASWQS